MLSDLALWLTLISSNYPCLEHIYMVPKVFEPSKFYCRYLETMSLREIGPQLKLPINETKGSMPLQGNTYFPQVFAI